MGGKKQVTVPIIPPRCRWSRFARAGLALLLLTGCPSCGGPPVKPQPSLSLRPLWTSAPLSGTLSHTSFSPDGSHLVVALRTGEGAGSQDQLWIVGPEGTRCIARGPRLSDPQWSPIGEQIAYLDRAEQHLYLARLGVKAADDGVPLAPPTKLALIDATTGVSRTLKAPAGYYGPPRWSPDGKAIALGAWLTEGEPLTGLVTGLVVLDALAESAQVIPIGDFAAYHASLPVAWSPDGDHLAIASLNPLARTEEIWIADRAQGSAQRFWSVEKPAHVRGVAFDPATGLPCYLSVTHGDLTEKATETAVLFRCDAQTNHQIQVAKLTSAPGWLIADPQISSDGQAVVVLSVNALLQDKGAPPQAVILWARSAQSARCDLPSGLSNGLLAWSRDGTRIAISQRDGQDSRITVYGFATPDIGDRGN